jgi:hypothetical protein
MFDKRDNTKISLKDEIDMVKKQNVILDQIKKEVEK